MSRERTDPIYAEFDDVDMSHWPFVSSKMALAAIKALAAKHGLGFLFNPGGGQFTCIDTSRPLYGLNVQISTNDDVEDLNTLRSSIEAAVSRADHR